MTMWQYMAENPCMTFVLASFTLLALDIIFSKPAAAEKPDDEGGDE